MTLPCLGLVFWRHSAVRLWLCFAFCLTAWVSAVPQADKEWQTYKSGSHAIASARCAGNAPVKYEHPLLDVQPAPTIKFWRSEKDNSTALEVTYRAWAVNGDQPGIYALLGEFKMEVRYVDPDKGTTEIVMDGDHVDLTVSKGQTETTGSVFINLPYLDDRHLIFTREGDDKVLQSPHVRVVELSCED